MGNFSLHAERDSDELSTRFKVSLAVLTYGGSLVGVAGNVLVMLAVMCTASMRHRVADMLVFNLAVTDILVCAIPMPVLGSYFVLDWPEWRLGGITCQATAYIVNVCSMVSVLTLVVIAVDRYFAIVRNRHVIRLRPLAGLVVAMWLASAIALIYPLIDGGVAREVVGGTVHRVCNKMSGRQLTNASFKRSSILKLAVGVAVQAVLLILYARMGYTLWVWRKLPTAESSAGKSVRQSRKMKLRAFRMMFAIVVAFGVFWMPYWVTTFLRIYPPHEGHTLPAEVVLLTYAVAMLNSVVNPVLYALLSKKFRRAYMRVLSGCRKRATARSSTRSRKVTVTSLQSGVSTSAAITRGM